jgi:hypothetical protein
VIEALPKGNRDCGLLRKVLDTFRVLGEERFLDEERLVGLKQLGKLLGHGLVNAAVKVQSDIKAKRLYRLQAFDRSLKR